MGVISHARKNLAGEFDVFPVTDIALSIHIFSNCNHGSIGFQANSMKTSRLDVNNILPDTDISLAIQIVTRRNNNTVIS